MLQLLVIRSAQPDRLVEFYEHFLSPFVHHQHGTGPMHFSSTISGLVFEIYPLLYDQKQADCSTRLGFQVEAVDHLINELQVAGYTIISFPKYSLWGYQAVVKDPDGRKIELIQKQL